MGGQMSRKLSETEAVCNLIKYRRRYSTTRQRTKSITIPLFEDDDNRTNDRASARTIITCNISTGNVTMSHSLRCKRTDIYPNVFGKLECNTPRGIEFLRKVRCAHKEYSKEHYKDNKEDICSKSKKYYEEHTEEILLTAKDRYKKRKIEGENIL